MADGFGHQHAPGRVRHNESKVEQVQGLTAGERPVPEACRRGRAVDKRTRLLARSGCGFDLGGSFLEIVNVSGWTSP